MFKTIEKKWNAHTPVWLHNGTKENIIFQLTAGTLLTVALIGWEEYKLRRKYPDEFGRKKSKKK